VTKAVFLDRDGVINDCIVREQKPHPPDSVENVTILPGVKNSLKQLRQAGYLIIVVTNQPDISRGTTTLQKVEEINIFLEQQLDIDAIYMCTHDDSDHCSCRKPNPGLLMQAGSDFNVELCKSYMVGDRWKDIAAGKAADCTTFFIDYNYAERQPRHLDYRVSSLEQAVDIILNELEQ